jgi:hypothetical protein
MLALLSRCEFFTLEQFFQSLDFFIKIDQWILKVIGCSFGALMKILILIALP